MQALRQAQGERAPFGLSLPKPMRPLDKLRARQPAAAASLGSNSSNGLVTIGPTESYRQEVLAGGHLGDTDAFRSVVPDAGRAGAVLFVNMDAIKSAMSQVMAGDPGFAANIAPLKAIGYSTWVDGGVAHMSFEVGTD